jgi:hypothetical protein
MSQTSDVYIYIHDVYISRCIRIKTDMCQYIWTRMLECRASGIKMSRIWHQIQISIHMDGHMLICTDRARAHWKTRVRGSSNSPSCNSRYMKSSQGAELGRERQFYGTISPTPIRSIPCLQTVVRISCSWTRRHISQLAQDPPSPLLYISD